MNRESPRRLRHQEAWELLPWYVNRTLAGDEREAVEAHLERCPLCRVEVAAGEELALAVRRGAAAPPDTGRLARLLARLDEPGEADGREVAELAGSTALPSALPAPAHPSAPRLPPAVRWALALQAAAVLALALGLGSLLAARDPAPAGAAPAVPADLTSAPSDPTSAAEPGYRTLAAPAPPATGEGLAVRAVFSPTASERELRRLLLAAGARFAGGPSPAGVYTLEIAGDEAAAAAALALLRRDPHVELAEPVVVTAPAEDGR